jgi:hypothetical protein
MLVEVLYIVLVVLSKNWVPRPRTSNRIEQHDVMNAAMLASSLLSVIVRTGPLPNDLCSEMICAEDGVHQHFQVVAGGGVAVQVDGAGGFENTFEFEEAWGHHGEIGHHVGVAEEGAEGAHGVGDLAPAFDDLLERVFGVEVPFPGVFEGRDLGGGLGAVFFGKEDVVVGAGVEGRVEIDEVYGGGGNAFA